MRKKKGKGKGVILSRPRKNLVGNFSLESGTFMFCLGILKLEKKRKTFFFYSPTSSKYFIFPMNKTRNWPNSENAHGDTNLISSFYIHTRASSLIAKSTFSCGWIVSGVREKEKEKGFQGKWKLHKKERIIQVKLKLRDCLKKSVSIFVMVT